MCLKITKEKEKRERESVCEREEGEEKRATGAPGSQLLGYCLLLAMSCNCQVILSLAFHHDAEPGSEEAT